MERIQADGLPLPQRYGAILTIIIGISMAVLDGAIANVALPTIAADLQASAASSIWVVNACHSHFWAICLATDLFINVGWSFFCSLHYFVPYQIPYKC